MRLTKYFIDCREASKGGAYGTYGREGKCMHDLLGKLERETRLGKTRCRWKDNIEMGLKLTRSGAMGWLNFSQNTDKWQAFVNTVMNLQTMGMF